MAGPGRRRSSSELARDRRRISDLYLRGWIQADIAEKLGVSQATISGDIKGLQREWLKTALIDFDKAKARELAKIDDLERTYHAAWERSREDAETTTQKMIETDDVIDKAIKEVLGPRGRKEMTKTTKGQAGDPRFLQGIQWCIERRCKIVGIDAPQRREITGKDGGPIETTDVDGVTDDERVARIAALLDEARARRTGPAGED